MSTSCIPFVAKYYKDHSDEILADLITFLRFQTISAQPAYKTEILKCGDWLKAYLERMQFKVTVWQTGGNPVIYAENLSAGPDKPTVLIYNHYDVQPVDPLDLWHSPPFSPVIKEGEIYARGANDNKGQCLYVLQALKALLAKDKKLPLNIKLCIEGEEETGSLGLSEIVKKKQKELAADYLLVVDVGVPSLKEPAVTLGVRGLVTMDLSVQCASHDVHSGMEGGRIPNPIHILANLIAKAHDKSGKVAIPGFYDDVAFLSQEERDNLHFDFDEIAYKELHGTHAVGGEKDLHPTERVWLRPTLEVNGITGGYSGDGFKTVIPALASAKISCRLVPNQQTEIVLEKVKHFFESMSSPGIKITLNAHHSGGNAMRTSPTSKLVIAAKQAFSEVFHIPCKAILEGGSIPITAQLAKASGADVAWIGLGLASDCIHAPNEHFGIERIEKGMQVIARTVELLIN